MVGPAPGGGGGQGRAAPPDDWWEVRYTTQGSPSGRLTGPAPVPGVVYLEAPTSAAARAKAIEEKPGATVTSVTGPYTPAQKDKKVGEVTVPGLSGLAAIGDFFARLGQANTWIRAGQAVLGLILIGIGLARITGTANLASTIVKARIP